MSRFSQQISVSTAPISKALSVVHTKTVFPRVLGNLVKVFSDQFLLLNELYIRQGLGRKLYCLKPKRIILIMFYLNTT